MARAIFTWLFLVLVYFFINNSLVSQLQEPVLVYPGSDNTFWLLHILNIPQFLLKHYWAGLSFDILLTCSCITCIIVPQQRFFTWTTIAGVWILYIVYCSTAGKHYAQIGYLLTPIPFLVLSANKFDMLWELLRYWVCFLYLSAGIYKIYYGGFGYQATMSNILFQDNADWFVFYKEGMQFDTCHYLIQHPVIAQWLYRLATFTDLFCIIGFFTKRFDKWILAGLLGFHLANLFLLHISFVEQSLIFAPFLPWRRWADYFQLNKSDD
jgi:hypothetical protein